MGCGQLKPNPTPEEAKRQLQDLQSWTDDTDKDEDRRKFSVLKRRAEEWQKRYHWWHLPAFVIAAAQAVMFALAIAPLFVEDGIPKFLLSCNHNVRTV